jgi:hypothetical protein
MKKKGAKMRKKSDRTSAEIRQTTDIFYEQQFLTDHLRYCNTSAEVALRMWLCFPAGLSFTNPAQL